MHHQEGKAVKVRFFALCRGNWKYLRRTVFKPYLKMLCLRMILFYQRHLSRHDCKYTPSCSQYTLESINNKGVILGILHGAWRILRCNPWTKGGCDPAPEKHALKKWLL